MLGVEGGWGGGGGHHLTSKINHSKSAGYFMLLSTRMTVFPGNPVTPSEGQGHSNWYQVVEFSHVWLHNELVTTLHHKVTYFDIKMQNLVVSMVIPRLNQICS